MPDGIFDEIVKYPFYKPDIRKNKGKTFCKICLEPVLFLLSNKLELLHDILYEFAQRERFGADLDIG